jgi:hypothetical protein
LSILTIMRKDDLIMITLKISLDSIILIGL